MPTLLQRNLSINQKIIIFILFCLDLSDKFLPYSALSMTLIKEYLITIFKFHNINYIKWQKRLALSYLDAY